MTTLGLTHKFRTFWNTFLNGTIASTKSNSTQIDEALRKLITDFETYKSDISHKVNHLLEQNHACMGELGNLREENHKRYVEFLDLSASIKNLEDQSYSFTNHCSSFDGVLRSLRREQTDLSIAVNAKITDLLLTASKRLEDPHTQDNSNLSRASFEEVKELIQTIKDRVDFVRFEIMYELKYGKDYTPESAQALNPKILNYDAYNKTEKRINLGCGHIPKEDYINVDMRDLPSVDIVAEVGNLPFDHQSLSEIYSAHLLEHFPEQDLSRRLLPYWFTLLKSGATFRAVIPDWVNMMKNWSEGNFDFNKLKEVTFGGQEYTGDFHFSMFSQEGIIKLLTDTGFINVEVIANSRVNGNCLEMEVKAIKP
jgi:hypothetical protein